jgi:tRNA(Ile)-lysidine synthase
LLAKQLLTFLQKPELISRPLVVAYSGGVDSQVLLHLLVKLKTSNQISNEISVVHVHHGLSDNADHWLSFCQQQCLQMAVDFIPVQIDLYRQARQSLEDIARKARYQQLAKHSKANALILTGHHSDDQAETLLLALKRGSGVQGMAAMGALKVFDGGRIIGRPLLNISRAQIELYAQQHQLAWINDESNADTRFDRNFIRHQVMPVLTERWPQITKTMFRTAQLCSQSQELLDELAYEDFQTIGGQLPNEHSGLEIGKLQQLILDKSLNRGLNLLRYVLNACLDLPPSKAQLTLIVDNFFQAAQDKNPKIKLGKHWLRRYDGKLFLTPDYQEIQNIELLVDLGKSTTYQLPDKLGALAFSIKKFDGELDSLPLEPQSLIIPPTKAQQVSITFNHNNPMVKPQGRAHSRSLKKIYQEMKIPTWQRKRIPLLYYNQQLVAALGVFIEQGFIPHAGQDVLTITWQNNNNLALNGA